MIRIWIKQVFEIFSNFFWINENLTENFPKIEPVLKEGWIIGLYKYKNPDVKKAIWQMKYRSNRNTAKFFGREMAKALINNNLEEYILVPIPIHWRRRVERGFNQTEWLCREIFINYKANYSNKTNMSTKIKYGKVLKRVIYSKKQSWNNKEVRQKNIISVFKVKNKFKEYIVGKNFLLIDDVVTTGATLKEACHELLIHGASSVKALTVAY